MKTGRLLRKHRNSHKVSQLSLEVELDLAFGSISRIENGKVNPTKETIIKISEKLQLKWYETGELLGLRIPIERKA